MLNLAKAYYLLRLGFFALVAGVSLFWMGWYMGQHNYRQKITAALKAGEHAQAAMTLVEWSKLPQFDSDPVYFLSCLSFCLDRGNIEAARHNLKHALALLEK